MGSCGRTGEHDADIVAANVPRATIATRARRLLTHEARRFVLPLAVLTLISTVGTAAAPSLAHEQPLLLVALSPRLTFLTLAASKTSLVSFMIVGLIRLCLADPFHFALGRRHGTSALDRIGRMAGPFGRAVGALRTITGRSIPVLVLLRPNGTNLAIAGASPSNRLQVVVADVVGTAAYLILIRTAGTALF